MGIGAAWGWHLPVLLVLALALGGGETFETSLILFALRHGGHLEVGRPLFQNASLLRQPTLYAGSDGSSAS